MNRVPLCLFITKIFPCLPRLHLSSSPKWLSKCVYLEFFTFLPYVPCMGSGWALGCTVLKSVLNVHLVAGLVRSYLEETILLKEEEHRNQTSALSENAGDKCAPVITFLFCASRHR